MQLGLLSLFKIVSKKLREEQKEIKQDKNFERANKMEDIIVKKEMMHK